MKTLIKVLLFVLPAILFTRCENNDGPLISEMEIGQISIELNLESIPTEVIQIKGMLFRPDFDTIFIDFEFGEQNATALVEGIPVGQWTLRVNAYNSAEDIIYSGSVQIKVHAGTVTQIHMHLSQTGSLEIIITWEDGIPEPKGRQIAIMNINESKNTILTKDAGRKSFPAFSPDGSKIAYWSEKEIYIMNSDGSNQMNLTNYPVSSNVYGYHRPVFFPDGSKIIFPSDRDGNYEIYLMNINGSNQTNLTNNPGYDVDPAIAQDGSLIVFRSVRNGQNDIYSMNIDGSKQINLTNNSMDDDSPDISPNGSKIVWVSNNSNISIMNVDGSGKTILSTGDSPIFTPDGTKIVFTVGNPADIYIMNIDGSDKTNLTNTNEWSGEPVISPDGMKIAYRSDPDNYLPYLFIMNIDGTGKTILTGPNDFSPSFSPDGLKIAFESDLP